ncbi:MAG: cytoskeleton protein RodZ [Parcubacteria group bacterium Gr01-1014_38]|nr:MAG: cytoskeleton protein RodZ [Parcubacteria group bacterium Gr01-1014_38]
MISVDPRTGDREPGEQGPARTSVLAPAPATAPLQVGEQLRAARERQDLELEALARALRIPLKMLRALEEGDFSVLPADVYVRGFLKQYAEALGVHPVPLLREFTVERARFPIPLKPLPWVRRTRARWKVPLWMFLSPRSLAILVGAGGLAAVLLYVLFNVRTFTRPPQLDVFEPSQDLEVQDSTLTVRGRTDATAELFINGERILVRDDGSFAETVGLGEGVNTLRIVAKSIGGRETLVVREILRRPKPAPTGTPAAGAATSPVTVGPLSVTVRAEGEAVWVSLTAEDHTVFSGLLTPGAEQTVRGERIFVTSGKAAKTRIRIDGEDRGVLAAAPGVVRGILFTRNRATGTIERHEPEEISP